VFRLLRFSWVYGVHPRERLYQREFSGLFPGVLTIHRTLVRVEDFFDLFSALGRPPNGRPWSEIRNMP